MHQTLNSIAIFERSPIETLALPSLSVEAASNASILRFCGAKPAGRTVLSIRRVVAAAAILISTTMTSSAATSLKGFHIGNSLTEYSDPDKLANSYARNEQTPTVAWHINHSQSAAAIASNPAGVEGVVKRTVSFFGNWDNALPNYEWDYVTIQSYYGTIGVAEAAGFQRLIDSVKSNAANVHTKIYIYQTWMSNSRVPTQETYKTQWDAVYADLNQTVVPNHHFFDQLRQKLQADNPATFIGVIPVGEVLAALDVSLRAHPVQGRNTLLTSAWDLYSDQIHVIDEGRYVAHMTILATILNKKPADIIVNSIVASYASAEFRALADDVIEAICFRIPTLTMAPSGEGQISLSWTPTTSGFVLQETSSLISPN